MYMGYYADLLKGWLRQVCKLYVKPIIGIFYISPKACMKKLRFVHRTIFADNSTIYSL